MPGTIEVHLLGGVTVRVDGRPLTRLPTRVSEALLIYLLYQARPVARDQLSDWFFQGSTPQQARVNLRATLSRIRKATGDIFVTDRATVGIRDAIDVAIDAHRFSDTLAAQRDSAEREPLLAALALYRGDFLAGFHLRDAPEFEQWQIVEQERLRLLAIDGFRRAVRLLDSAGAYGLALDHVNRLLAIEPLLEQAHRSKLMLLARTGQRALALRHFQAAERHFADELGIALSAETIALRDRLQTLPDRPAFALPPRRTPLIGRDAELATLRSLLAAPAQRLITLLGPGGAGKTTLALAVARRLQEEAPGAFLDGVYFVSLDGVESADALPRIIAETLGAPLRGNRPVANQLLDHLQPRELLLILDNFEHLAPDGCRFVAELLANAGAIKLLVTSRARLHLYEETVFDVNGLSLPPAETPDKAVDPSPAVALFAARARQQRRAFDVAAELEAVEHICRVLDGLPLAIELAAGWVRELTCTDIATNIDRELAFLETRLHDVPARQRSVRAVFDHSWRLLSSQQQRALAALSYFPASFSAAAAATVASVDRPTLHDLLDRSLLYRDETDRFHFHALVRAFAAKHPDAENEIARKHAVWYVAEATRQDEAFLDKDRFIHIRRELPHLLAAWRWSVRHNADSNLVRLLRPLFEYFNWSSTWEAGIDLARETLARLPETAYTLRALVGVRLTGLLIFLSRLEAADAAAEHALKMFEHVDEPAEKAALLGSWARSKVLRGLFADAIDLGQAGLALAYAAEDAEAIAFNHDLLGSAFKSLGRLDQAADHIQAALRLRREQGDELGAAIAMNNYGNLLRDQGEYQAAKHTYAEAIAVLRRLEHTHGTATVLSNAAIASMNLGAYAEAESLQRESLALKRALGNPRSIALSLAALADACTYQGRFDDARDALREGLQLSLESASDLAVDEIIVSWAEWHLATNNEAAAAPLLALLAAGDARHAPLRDRVNQLFTKVSADRLPAQPPTRQAILAQLAEL